MNTIRISRVFEFNASHALRTSDGRCKPIHGHSYRLTVTLLGDPSVEENDHQKGMVINFSDLRGLVEELIINPWENALLLHHEAPAGLIDSWKKIEKKLVLLPYQPTCENLLLDIRRRLLDHMPDYLLLHSLKLSESENLFVEWHASDNMLMRMADLDTKSNENGFVEDCLYKANATEW